MDKLDIEKLCGKCDIWTTAGLDREWAKFPPLNSATLNWGGAKGKGRRNGFKNVKYILVSNFGKFFKTSFFLTWLVDHSSSHLVKTQKQALHLKIA